MAELIFVSNNDRYDLYYLAPGVPYGSINITWPRPDETEVRLGGLIRKGRSQKIGDVAKDWINDRPLLSITQMIEFTDGSKQQDSWQYKLKTKPFMRSQNWIDEIGMNGYVVNLKKTEQDIHALKKSARKRTKPPADRVPVSTGIDLSALFSYEPVIDLHADALDIKTQGKKSGKIVELQLAAFRRWLDKGVRLQVSPLRVVHGVGKGMLRSRVQTILAEHPEVLRFKNEYHPRYGHGSTEIILRRS